MLPTSRKPTSDERHLNAVESIIHPNFTLDHSYDFALLRLEYPIVDNVYGIGLYSQYRCESANFPFFLKYFDYQCKYNLYQKQVFKGTVIKILKISQYIPFGFGIHDILVTFETHSFKGVIFF